MEQVDIFVSGGGIAGLVAAAAFGRAGFSVIVADPAPAGGAANDMRSTAYLRPGRELIARAGLWAALQAHATPLRRLRVIDSTGWPPEIRDSRDFLAEDSGAPAFGWNLMNRDTRPLLAEAVRAAPHVDYREGVGFRDAVLRDSAARITLTDGSRLSARLAVAADGRDSPLREAAGISTSVARYGQRALAFAVTHPEPHRETSTEIYNRGGAFTLIPLPDQDHRPASAVVWMEDGPRALDLAAMDPEALARVATERSCDTLGPLALASPVQVWPVVTRRARAMVARRVALVAEAAHVLPPIGAQGLNTSLADIAALLDLAEGARDALGEPGMLAAYARRRGRDIALRAAAIDLFNRTCRSGAVPVQALRRAGLRLVHDAVPLRRAVMRAGLGP